MKGRQMLVAQKILPMVLAVDAHYKGVKNAPQEERQRVKAEMAEFTAEERRELIDWLATRYTERLKKAGLFEGRPSGVIPPHPKFPSEQEDEAERTKEHNLLQARADELAGFAEEVMVLKRGGVTGIYRFSVYCIFGDRDWDIIGEEMSFAQCMGVLDGIAAAMRRFQNREDA